MDQEALRKCSAVLCNSLDVRSIALLLYHKNLLTNEELKRLDYTFASNVEKVRFLINALPTKGTGWFDRFIDCLKITTKGTGHGKILQELLYAKEHAVSTVDDEGDEVLPKKVELHDQRSLLEQGVEMKELGKIVIPNIETEWKYLAYCMGYTLQEVKMYEKEFRSPNECCTKVFDNWLRTDRGPSPKTYQTLLEHIKEVDELTVASEEIERELIKVLPKKVELHDQRSLLEQGVEMWELTKIVIPKIKASWMEFAYCMRFTVHEVKMYEKESKSSKECCIKVFEEWLNTGRGPSPKTYQTLLKYIKEVDELTATSEVIESELIKALHQQ